MCDGASMRRWPRSPWVDVVVILVFSGRTIAMTWPAAARMGTHFVGGDIDVWHNPWVTWWTRTALLEGEGLYYTRATCSIQRA